MPGNQPTTSAERILAFGDIHGCLEQLQSLLQQVKPTHQDKLIFLGDYVDRGPDSAGVLDYLIDFSQTYPETIFLRGNHEQMFLDYLNGRNHHLFLMNGGIETLDSYDLSGGHRVPDSHIAFLESLRTFYSYEDFLFVHAGLRPGLDIDRQDEQDMLWIRQDFISSDYDWGKTIVFGHTPLKNPLLSTGRIGLDTGCVYGRQLTCCEVRSRAIWQA